MLQNSGCAAVRGGERRSNRWAFGDLLSADAAHRPGCSKYCADFEIRSGVGPSGRRRSQFGESPFGQIIPIYFDTQPQPAGAATPPPTADGAEPAE